MKKHTDSELQKNYSINYVSKSLEELLMGNYQIFSDESLFNVEKKDLKEKNVTNYKNIIYNGKDNDNLEKSKLEVIDDGNITITNVPISTGCGKSPGRKKTHPVWIFFKDLKDERPSEIGIMCLHCNWKGTDKSPNNLQVHLKKFHGNDGIYEKYCAALAIIPIHPYARRKGTPNDNNSRHSLISGRLCNYNSLTNYTIDSLKLSALNPLFTSVPKTQNINIPQSNLLSQISNQKQDSSLISLLDKNVSILSKNETFLDNSKTSTPTLDRENFFGKLFTIAKDLNISITYSYNDQHEFSFSRKDTNNQPNNFGKSVVFRDYPYEIKVYEKNEIGIVECETFKKTDWSQIHWALRGKIQSILFKDKKDVVIV